MQSPTAGPGEPPHREPWNTSLHVSIDVVLPSEDRLILFDQHRQLITSLAEEVMEADLDMLRTLAQRVVATAWADGRELGAVIPTGPALPFFDAVAMAPPDGSEPPVGTAWPDDVLIWFAA